MPNSKHLRQPLFYSIIFRSAAMGAFFYENAFEITTAMPAKTLFALLFFQSVLFFLSALFFQFMFFIFDLTPRCFRFSFLIQSFYIFE